MTLLDLAEALLEEVKYYDKPIYRSELALMIKRLSIDNPEQQLGTLRLELGQCKSYIAELEDTIKALKRHPKCCKTIKKIHIQS